MKIGIVGYGVIGHVHAKVIGELGQKVTAVCDIDGEKLKTVDFAKNVAASAKTGLRMTMTVLPIVGLFVAIIVFKKKFILSEEKMEEITTKIKNAD